MFFETHLKCIKPIQQSRFRWEKPQNIPPVLPLGFRRLVPKCSIFPMRNQNLNPSSGGERFPLFCPNDRGYYRVFPLSAFFLTFFSTGERMPTIKEKPVKTLGRWYAGSLTAEEKEWKWYGKLKVSQRLMRQSYLASTRYGACSLVCTHVWVGPC